ncbi:MAG: adenosylcobinamide-phosphate synthase CbiB [Bacillota bacterium]|nr:adenosylcobinamide-phosphate synthase CbiB [Bacillota bacterium]
MFELSVVLAFALDLLFADPVRIPHPVVIIGRGISFLEKNLRNIFPDSPTGRRAAGGVMAFLIPVTTFIVTGGLCIIAYMIHPVLFFCLHTFWCWQAIAVSGLAREASGVYRQLSPVCDIDAARRAVGRIVGRDTAALDEAGVTRAAVETIAENYSDGVMAPFFYMMIGGAPLALTYKSINTMDSMVGYKNDVYIDFGRHPAHLDDAAGFIPARLGAILWICAAGLTGQNAKDAFRIWRRDNRNHASPNSAQTESACAGALGVQLAGPAYYFGELYEKPTIGDPLRPIEAEDIKRTNRMLYAASVLSLLLCMAAGCWTILL